jgi:hypothetical protein
MLKTTPQENKELQSLIDNVFKEMVSTGTHTVTVTYSGSGDEGWSDLVMCLDEQGKKTQMKENSALSVFEFIDRNLIAGWENNDGGEGTLTFIAPNTFSIKHGLYEPKVESTEYTWSTEGFVKKEPDSIPPEKAKVITEGIKPILDIIPILQEQFPDIVGIVCFVSEEADSGLISEVCIVNKGEYYRDYYVLSPLHLSEMIKKESSPSTLTVAWIADTSINIIESLYGSLREDDTAMVYYRNHSSVGAGMTCEVDVLVPKTHTYTL